MVFLIANWKSIIAVIATAALAWLLHTVDVNRLEKKEAADIATQQNVDVKSCNADKAVTEKVSHDYEDKITALAGQLDNLRRVRPNVCVTVTSNATPRRDATTESALPSRQDTGVNSDALYALAGEGERYRLQLIACQAFITDTWAEQAAKQ